MGNNKKLAKLGIIVTAVVIVFGVALFVFKGQENKVEPVENDFSVTRIQEDTPNEVGLIENESKFNEVETETVEDIEEIVDKAIEEIDKEDSDHLEGITVHSKEDADSVESEKVDSEKDSPSKENLEKADSEKADSEKSDKTNSAKTDSENTEKGNNEKVDSEKSNSEKSDSTNTNSNSDKASSGTTDNNGQVNNGEQNSTVNTPVTQSTPVVVEQPAPQPELTDEYYANLAAQWGVEYIGDVSGASGPGTQGVGRLE